jgi:GNAT superfamily N-acetyltransferase
VQTVVVRDDGGDPACWLSRVCDHCGALIDSAEPHRCRTPVPPNDRVESRPSNADWVRLELDLAGFEADRFADVAAAVHSSGIALTTLAEVGDTIEHHRALYELNAECAADIPGRGPFFSWPEYRRRRLDVPSFDPGGVVLAVDGDRWVGLAASSDHRKQGFVFNEMTGVRREHRRQGIALAMKVHAIDHARRRGAPVMRTVHHPANVAMITLNRALGYVDADFPYPLPAPAPGTC